MQKVTVITIHINAQDNIAEVIEQEYPVVDSHEALDLRMSATDVFMSKPVKTYILPIKELRNFINGLNLLAGCSEVDTQLPFTRKFIIPKSGV